MQEDYFKRYYCTNKEGRHLFYLELFSIEDCPILFYDCSLSLILHDHSDLKNLIALISNLETVPEKRDELMDILFKKIQEIPGVEKYYFKSDVLDRQGKYNDSYIRVLDEIFFNHEFKEYTPFSENVNSYFFSKLKEALSNYNQGDITIEVAKECFEELVRNASELEDAYIDVYSASAQFQVICVKFEVWSYEFYIMYQEKIELIFFKLSH